MALIWPGACESAVSLTFDDGTDSQLALAVPWLARAGLQATFYLNPGQDLAVWRPVAQAGHELGNHTVSHPCSEAFDFVLEGQGLESMTLETLAADIDLAEQRLQALDGRPAEKRSFAYPCYQDTVGAGRARTSYVPLVAARFLAARARGEQPNDPAHCDLHHLWSFPVERMNGAEMIGTIELAAAAGAWAILTFHGIQEGGLAVRGTDLGQVCTHLARHRGRIWTAPVATVAARVAAWRTAATP